VNARSFWRRRGDRGGNAARVEGGWQDRPIASIGAARAQRAFTLVEMLVVISIIAILMGLILPAIGKARDSALTTRSAANLRNLSVAHAAYAADWSDRQWTAVPDDAGLFTTKYGMSNWYQAYMAGLGSNGGCPPQMSLGWDANEQPTLWGMFLPCFTEGGSTGAFVHYQPFQFTPGWALGSYRLINCDGFNGYLNGRFYDPVFYAPKDNIILEGAEKYFGLPDEFTQIPPDGTGLVPGVWSSSYICSPAAMWSPDVLSRNQVTGKYYTAPWTLPGGYRSPPSSAATYPDLKTRMIEHHWLQGRPGGDVNYFFSGGYTPWFFNHGYASAPMSLFFDGHVRLVGCAEAMTADCRADAGLWSRNTPLGGSPKCTAKEGIGGYFTSQSYDYITSTSHTILTIDGIKGRDVLGVAN